MRYLVIQHIYYRKNHIDQGRKIKSCNQEKAEKTLKKYFFRFILV